MAAARRRIVWALVLLLLAIVAGAAASWRRARVRWLVTQVWRTGGSALADLEVDKSAAGTEALEEVAFDHGVEADPRRRSVRQRALDELWRREKEPDEPRLLRYLLEARGLERPFALATAKIRSGTQPLLDAAVEVLTTDSDAAACEWACRFLRRNGDWHSLVALRRATRSPHPLVRQEACEALGEIPDPTNVAFLRGRRDDPVPRVKLAAALSLARAYHDDSGLQLLVEVVDRPFSDLTIWHEALEQVMELGGRRVIRFLSRLHGPPDGFEWEGRRELTAALERITGARSGDVESWTAWADAHAAELPPQIEPERAR
ncbi:MAG TPA: HEAT repeat domain-containing protein [Planctomycetota bacterium]|nr:HEAT repeat domain-containing protein [Planctomycetota bacterium]